MDADFPATPRVVLFYTDLPAADRALRATRARLGDRAFEPALWAVELLAEAHWLRFALADASGADLCVLSLGETDPRANDVAAWLRELAPRLARHWIDVSLTDASSDTAEPAARRAG